MNRLIETPEQITIPLEDHLAAQPPRGRQTLKVPASTNRPARTAQLEVRFAPLSLPVPRVRNAWIREHAPAQPLAMWVVELKEVEPPDDAEPVHWVLLTSEEVTTLEQALKVTGETAHDQD